MAVRTKLDRCVVTICSGHTPSFQERVVVEKKLKHYTYSITLQTHETIAKQATELVIFHQPDIDSPNRWLVHESSHLRL